MIPDVQTIHSQWQRIQFAKDLKSLLRMPASSAWVTSNGSCLVTQRSPVHHQVILFSIVIQSCDSSQSWMQLEAFPPLVQDPAFVRKQREVQEALSGKYRSSKTTGAVHDRRATSSLQPISSEVVDVSPPPTLPFFTRELTVSSHVSELKPCHVVTCGGLSNAHTGSYLCVPPIHPPYHLIAACMLLHATQQRKVYNIAGLKLGGKDRHLWRLRLHCPAFYGSTAALLPPIHSPPSPFHMTSTSLHTSSRLPTSCSS